MKIKINLILLLLFLSQMIGFSQSISELESELKDKPISDLRKTRTLARELLKMDKYNETAILYFVSTFYPLKDSISVFFDNLVTSDPGNPIPYILRAKYESYDDISFSDTSKLILLKKAYQIDKNNIEANYLLGVSYYTLFVNYTRSDTDYQKRFARNSKLYLTNLIKLDKNSIERSKYLLIQLSNFLHDEWSPTFLENGIFVNNQDYFPLKLLEGLPADWETNYKFNVIKALNRLAFRINWYSEQLQGLQEPILYNHFSGKEIFRFTWLRSFHNPIAIRLEKTSDRVSVFWKLSNGAGGYKPGELIIDKSKELTLVEWKKFNTLLEKFNFWGIKTTDDEIMGTDGAQWILEGIDKTSYQVVDRWTPTESDFKTCCLYLISLTDLNIPKEEIY